MSIKSEIAKTKEYLRESRTAVLDRGGEISLTAGLKDLPSAIRSISADTSVVFQTDDSIAYVKTVPENAEPKAMLMSVGGMTYRDENTNTLRDSKVTEIINRDASGNEIARYTIPEEVQAIEGYGEGVNQQYHNYIDYDSKILVKEVERVIFTGDETWNRNTEAGDYWSFYISSTLSAFAKYVFSFFDTPFICNAFSVEQWASEKEKEFAWHSNGSCGIRIHKTRLPDYENLTDATSKVDAFKAWLKNQYDSGNPIVWDWALAESTATDISAYLADFDNILEVERGGSLEFVNEYGQAVPSSILYTVKVGT